MLIQDNDDGQSTIEFVMTLSFAIGMTMLFVSQALNMTVGFMVHYATFMGGRTYLTADNAQETSITSFARQEAIRAFERYSLQQFNIVPKVSVRTPSDSISIFSGIIAQYDKPLSPSRLLLNGERAVFYSEGFLGKEPIRSNCHKSVCRRVTDNGGECSGDMDVTLYDNGC